MSCNVTKPAPSMRTLKKLAQVDAAVAVDILGHRREVDAIDHAVLDQEAGRIDAKRPQVDGIFSNLEVLDEVPGRTLGTAAVVAALVEERVGAGSTCQAIDIELRAADDRIVALFTK